MKILVGVKRVIDHNVVARPNAEGSDVEWANAKMAINPFCEIAVEEAVRLKEAYGDCEVVVVSIGNDKAQEQIRGALAMGADRGILVTTETALEPLAVAKHLQKVIERENPQLVILGKQAIDNDNNQTGQMLAGLCGWPQGTFCSSVALNEDHIQVQREIDGGTETLELHMPAVLTADLRLNEPRFSSLPNIMKAKKKAVEVIPAADLNSPCPPRLTLLGVATPPPRKSGVKVASVAELIEKLTHEAKVIA